MVFHLALLSAWRTAPDRPYDPGSGDVPRWVPPGDAPGETTVVVLGPEVESGQVPQALIRSGTWQSAEPAGDTEALVSTVASPGFDFADFRTV
jgi:predicted cupin superfamily sugar epimerase